ncbi:pteridine reductase [Candidatus Thioglobus sp.]|jgi:pteridine reductase|uniref:pteridine reductase n=1 Tax=Candidatus Thioglobus sp. TaxID=2026721 RepID=UPI001D516B3A|nr:pteridine reductase [Candidatus Thioglobus sp.]MBT3276664.1 pteridine reductase [Candidatus Thioglobus sp.]MBT3447442.1 pteridine reductase [Candidatus Thioglobus sp.]MBT3744759.1 pteridine reductase [Candidatus Thioglobus sp.]MBT4000491.1 pteridine reductase [Candidatus Thioglobus sp.]MBT4747225.1 pteridine reductase [Candidatus Thioglobus sp.]
MKTALVTGGAHRIGQQICRTLHEANFTIIIHYNTSSIDAENLANEFNLIRANSARTIQAELSNIKDIEQLCQTIESLDLLVNNASVFYPTPINSLTLSDYQTTMNTNLMGPLFLSSTLSKKLSENQGSIVNIVDIHGDRPLKNHTIYNISKAAIAMMTKTLAKELAPNIRVNGVSPGSILWPENEAELSHDQKQSMLNKIALNKQGAATDIANTVLFLAQSDYITGQIIAVDGGRSLNQ